MREGHGVNEPRQNFNLVRLTDQQREALFRRLEGVSSAAETERPSHKNRRGEQRWPYRQHDVVVTIEHPGRSMSRFTVLTRNLSANGMSFIHGGYIHPTTHCRFMLQLAGGGEQVVAGRAVGCRHIEGVLHEVRVKFDQTVDPTIFLGRDRWLEAMPDAADLKGSLLYVAASDIEANLMTHQLESTGVTLMRVRSMDEALKACREARFDIAVIEMTLADEGEIKSIERLRKAEFAGPVLVITAETNQVRRDLATAAGAGQVLIRPFRAEQLHTQLQQLLRDHGSLPSEDIIYSTIAGKEGLVEMLLQFIEHANKVAAQLESALNEQNIDQARLACVKLKGSAAGYGYEILGEAAAQCAGRHRRTHGTRPVRRAARRPGQHVPPSRPQPGDSALERVTFGMSLRDGEPIGRPAISGRHGSAQTLRFRRGTSHRTR